MGEDEGELAREMVVVVVVVRERRVTRVIYNERG